MNIVEQRKKQLKDTGFLTSTSQEQVLDKVLNTIQNSQKFKSIGNPVLAQERINREQISFINNIRDLFQDGWQLVVFFKFYAKTKNIHDASGFNIWNVINAVEKKDRSNFSKLFTERRKSKDIKPKFNKKRTTKPKPQLNKNVEIIHKKKKTLKTDEKGS
tara:strand:- start:5589 stop:6068 length:480 start_codon:yes stop_codon:yes gene_type:complete